MANWIEIEKDALIKAIKVLEMIPMRSGTPSSDYVQMLPTKKYLEMAMASSVSTVLRVKWQAEDGQKALYIDRRLLFPFVMMGEKWKGNFQWRVEEGVLYLKQGSRTAEMSLRADPVEGYGQWKDLSGMTELKLTEDLQKMLLASASCSTADPALQHLNCVYINRSNVLASNGTTMLVGVCKDKSNLKIPFPVGIIPLLGGGLVEGVIIENNLVILDCGCGYIQGTVSSIAEKSFPRQSIIDAVKKAKEWPLLGKIPASRVVKMLERLTNYLVGMKREDWMLHLEFSDGKLKATVKIRQGVFEEKLDVKDLKKDAEVEWPLELVQPILNYMGNNAEFIRIRVDEDKKTPYLISAADVDLLVARRSKK